MASGIPPTVHTVPSTWSAAENADHCGCLQLVGAGPGDPELLTIAAYKALQSATLVVADRLTSKEILGLIPKGVEVRLARKVQGCSQEAQEEINNWCLEGLRQGHSVVRIKNGDPFLFGRGGEEVLFFRAHGFPVRVIPGVSACITAPLAAGIPVTHRGTASRLVVCTGMARNQGFPNVPDYDPTQTVVVLMAVARTQWLVDTMVNDRGYPRNCPAAVVERATMPGQRTVWGTLESIVEKSQEAGVNSPATLVVGKAVNCLDGEHYGRPDCVLAATAFMCNGIPSTENGVVTNGI